MSKKKLKGWNRIVEHIKHERPPRIQLLLLLARWYYWSRDSMDKWDDKEIPPELYGASESSACFDADFEKAFKKLCDKFTPRPVQPCPELQMTLSTELSRTTLMDTTASWSQQYGMLQGHLSAYREELSRYGHDILLEHKASDSLYAIKKWRMPERVELESAPPKPAAPLPINAKIAHDYTYKHSASRASSQQYPSYAAPSPAAQVPTQAVRKPKPAPPRVNVYYQVSAPDAGFEVDVKELMQSVSSLAREWDGGSLVAPAILFGFVRNLNSVDISDERVAQKWATTGRSVVVLCFGPNSRGQTDLFLRPKDFTGLPEEMPQLLRSFQSSNTRDAFIKCLLKSRADFTRGVTTITFDKNAPGDSNAGLQSYDGMIAVMQRYIAEAERT